jgi:hypothetical protein
MVDDDTDDEQIDDTEGAEADYAMPDPFSLAIELCRIAAKPATYAAAVKKLRKLGRDIAAAEQKLAALIARTEQTETALAEHEAELAARSTEIERRETEFQASLAEAHATLRASHDSLAQEDRRIRYRILTSADLLHGFSEQLQSLPTWQQIKQMIPGLPADLPPAPAVEVTQENVREDWTGQHTFIVGSTLSRSINKAAG